MTTTTTANAHQIGGTHYASKSIQPWDYIIANQLGYLEGNVVKYVSRWQPQPNDASTKPTLNAGKPKQPQPKNGAALRCPKTVTGGACSAFSKRQQKRSARLVSTLWRFTAAALRLRRLSAQGASPTSNSKSLIY